MKKIKKKISNIVCSIATYISPEFNTQLRFLVLTGKTANLKNPKTFREKLSWLKLNIYRNDKLVKQCADKYLVRAYVKNKGYEYMLNPLYNTYKNANEIDFDNLPNSFVLKWNYGCGFNIICKDKTKIKWSEAKRQLDKWRKNPFWPIYSELHYKTDNKLILCERYMDSDNPLGLLDYKFYCFHGKVMAVLVIARAEDGNRAVLMSADWEILGDNPAVYKDIIYPDKPECFDEMILAAEDLSSPFPFVRVDFYEYENNPVFGEMTFTPANGILPTQAKIDGKDMGEFINLNNLTGGDIIEVDKKNYQR